MSSDLKRNNPKYKENNNRDNVLLCPNCKERLTFLMPSGKYLYCNNCGKYYIKQNGTVGKETSSPYTRDDVLY